MIAFNFRGLNWGRRLKPTIGKIVHYPNPGNRDGKYPPEFHPAIITGINADGPVVRHVFYKTRQHDLLSIEQPRCLQAMTARGANGRASA